MRSFSFQMVISYCLLVLSVSPAQATSYLDAEALTEAFPEAFPGAFDPAEQIQGNGPQTGKSKVNAVLFVLDISSSMRGDPITQVKNTITQVASAVPAETGLGLVSFWGCKDTDNSLEVPLATGDENRKSLIARANAIQTKSGTNIYSALLLAEKEAQRVGTNWCVNVILLSDGFENCGPGDYKAVAGRIVGQHSSGCNHIHTINVTTAAWESAIMKEISEIGLGSNQQVENVKEVPLAINRIIEAVKITPKVKWVGENKPADKETPVKTPTDGEDNPPPEAKKPDTQPPAPAKAPAKEQPKTTGSGKG